MSGKGMFSGFAWHKEFHTVDPKKEKPADCVYLTNDRVCTNRLSPYNTQKCFVAAKCQYRQKANKATCGQAQIHKPAKREASCSLPKGCEIYHKKHGVGKFIAYDKTSRVITVEFEGSTEQFLYPDAFLQKHLYGNDLVDKCVRWDAGEK